MGFTINLQKIVYLTLLISKFAKNEKYYNTNDLIKIANEIKPELVRTRKDKKSKNSSKLTILYNNTNNNEIIRRRTRIRKYHSNDTKRSCW